MSGNYVRSPNTVGEYALGAFFAGIALIAVPFFRAVFGPAGSVEPAFWIMSVVGAALFSYGIVALFMNRRSEISENPASHETRVVLDGIRGP